ncbi:MAG: glycosyltransferase family 1 protein [Mucilaginibacter sp.]
MTKILFDHQAFSMQRVGGISRYFANIQKHLSQYTSLSFDRGVLFTNNAYIEEEKFPLPHWLLEPWYKRDKKIYKLNKKYAEYCLNSKGYDIFHPTYYDPYFLKIVKKPFVLTVHDFIHELFPEYFPDTDGTVHNKRLLIEKASHFIAISESTKNDLQQIYKIPDSKISMIYHGFDNISLPENAGASTPWSNYLLFVGDRWTYKNFFRWLQAVAPLLIKYDINAVCAGGRPFSSAEMEFIERLGIRNKITQTRASENELRALYRHTLLFIYPSLYEGFGLPILEAFANNCPVAVSDTSCFKEVGGDAVLYFDPNSVESMRSVIEGFLTDSDKAGELRAAGTTRLAKFSMQKCMDQTVKVYQSLV